MYHNYSKYLQPWANENRKSMTKSEAVMWKYLLSRRQIEGYQFRRQRPIDNYIVDFACLPLKLVIEVDGLSHDSEEAQQKDKIRDKRLKELGFTNLRFSAWKCSIEWMMFPQL